MKVLISNSGEVSKPFIERIQLMHGDVTQQDTDAIAMLIPQDLQYAGSINNSIRGAAGYDVDEFILENIYKPRVGEVYALPGGDLKAKHILVGVMPYYRTDFDMNESDLSGAVRRIMELARCMLLESISFPPLASGRKGYAKAKAARLVCQGINDRMQESFEEILIVCSEESMIEIFDRKLRIIGWDG